MGEQARPPGGYRSIPPGALARTEVMTRAVELLSRIEAMPQAATGALRFGTSGFALVESRFVCWAAASGMRERLTELLRNQRSPPLDRTFLHELYRHCRLTGVPLGQALLASGEISETGLRAALFSHTAEAIANLALAGAIFEDFVPHARAAYDARFRFSTAEILAYLGAHRNRALAAVARNNLREMLVAETGGWAFVRQEGTGAPLVIAADGDLQLHVAQMLEISSWVSGLFDVTGAFDEDVQVASASLKNGASMIAWRVPDIYFAAICKNRAAAARLVSRLVR